MKKIYLGAAIFLLGMAGNASANTIYTDNFLGTFNDGTYYELWTNQSVTFNFDILSEGYNPVLETIIAASLSFDFWSEDPQDETARIKAGFFDGNTLITEQWYDLGGWEWLFLSGNQAATTTLNIDLAGFLPYTQDGLFTSIVLTPYEGCLDFDNDFRIEGATFTAEAVPEPATMLLFGTGIAGLAGAARRRKK